MVTISYTNSLNRVQKQVVKKNINSLIYKSWKIKYQHNQNDQFWETQPMLMNENIETIIFHLSEWQKSKNLVTHPVGLPNRS